MLAKPDHLQNLQLLFESACYVLIRFPAQRCKETIDNLSV
jgi:hypothetical protein